MLELIVGFGLGVGILLVSTQAFVKLAVRIAKGWRLSPLIIGTTLVAMGTSLPELVVSASAILGGDAGLAWGNIVGSNVINVLLVLPVGIMVGKLRVGEVKTQRNVLVVLAATVVFVAVQAGWLSREVSGLVLLGMAVWVSVEEYRWGLDGRKHEDAVKLNRQDKIRLKAGDVGKLVVAAGGLVAGGIITVNTIKQVAGATGWSTSILGLTLTALATSLPELLATIFSQEEHQDKVTLGDIVGSNIYNLLLIGGVITLLSGTKALTGMEIAWLGASTVIFGGVLHVYSGKVVPRRVAGILLGVLGVYLLSLGAF